MEQNVINGRKKLIISFPEALLRLEQKLLKTGHSSRVKEDYIRVSRHFCYWYGQHNVTKDMGEAKIKEFYDHLGSCICPIPGRGSFRLCHAALGHFFHILTDMDLLEPIPEPVSPEDKILQEFREHLLKVHGITETSASVYIMHIKPFLQTIYTEEDYPFNALSAKDVENFVTRKAARYKPKTSKLCCTALRAFFRFLKLQGKIDLPLENAVPTVPDWKLVSIPKYLTDDQVAVFLSSFDHTPMGLRNRAMALLMVEMGLRAYEVANLQFEDINWQKSIIRICNTKSRRIDHHPLTSEAGKALAAYLKKRPEKQTRHVFISLATPVGNPLTSSAVSIAMRRAFKNCYPEDPPHGSHVLRHSLATSMLNKGATFKEIADFLRHRNIETTAIYAKVDLKNLRHAALSWPGVTK